MKAALSYIIATFLSSSSLALPFGQDDVAGQHFSNEALAMNGMTQDMSGDAGQDFFGFGDEQYGYDGGEEDHDDTWEDARDEDFEADDVGNAIRQERLMEEAQANQRPTKANKQMRGRNPPDEDLQRHDYDADDSAPSGLNHEDMSDNLHPSSVKSHKGERDLQAQNDDDGYPNGGAPLDESKSKAQKTDEDKSPKPDKSDDEPTEQGLSTKQKIGYTLTGMAIGAAGYGLHELFEKFSGKDESEEIEMMPVPTSTSTEYIGPTSTVSPQAQATELPGDAFPSHMLEGLVVGAESPNAPSIKVSVRQG